MPNSLPLTGKTIILTGSSFVQSISDFIEEHGGKVRLYPLIQTVEKEDVDDYERLAELSSYDWLIFTSQNAVSSFITKCIRYQINPASLTIKIAAVGEKTAALLTQHGLHIHFMPSIYSADMFIQEFQLEEGERALFLRGSLAKDTIREGTGAEEWTIYETIPCTTYIESFTHCLQTEESPIVIFASPSAVDSYATYIAPTIDWQKVQFASIGHVTTKALAKYGVTPIVQPKAYTMKAVIEQIILEESS